MKINAHLFVNEAELVFAFIRSPGPGGQNVNKVATAVLLRFNVLQSPSLPETVRARLIALLGNKLTREGYILIKATRHRTQERNKQDARERLQTMLHRATVIPKKRKKTKPTAASKQRRLDSKKHHSETKRLRSSVS